VPDAVRDLFGRDVILGIRPESIRLDASPTSLFGLATCQAAIEASEPLGFETWVYLKAGPMVFTARGNPAQSFQPGSTLPVGFDRDQLVVFDRSSGARLFCFSSPEPGAN
jgi:multiple sugar transport system ATP-binding protein